MGTAPVLRGARVVLRPPRESEAAELLRQHGTPEVARWWGAPAAGFPFEQDPLTQGFVIAVDDRPAGWMELTEEPDPDFRHAAIDLWVDPAHHRRGLASDAIATALHHLEGERGHHRTTIDPAADNHAAIACYARAGFERVGLLRSAWRAPSGAWRDLLLMERVRLP